MARRRDSEPSALRTGLVHAAFSLSVFGGLAGALGAGVHFIGDPDDASPHETIALFETNGDEAAPTLKSRLNTERPVIAMLDADPASWRDASGQVPDLGVEYVDAPSGGPGPEAYAAEALRAAPSNGVRINGKLMKPGESYSAQAQLISLANTPVPGIVEKVNGQVLPKIAPDGRSPADVFARPFENARQQPVISLVFSGLGINANNTKAAIEDLPPEVTLSFAPDAPKLQQWINKARAAGHEVLIEVPMEAHDYGRMKMHPQTLLATATADTNADKLTQVLSRATGYFGVINYQGGKFAEAGKPARAVLQALSDRGLAFIEDGSLAGSGLSDLSSDTSLRYARANLPIDAKLTAVDISAQFMELESVATERGAAMGSAYAFPLTIDMAKDWTAGLASKGIVLAPASALAARTPPGSVKPKAKPAAERVRTGSLPAASLQAGG